LVEAGANSLQSVPLTVFLREPLVMQYTQFKHEGFTVEYAVFGSGSEVVIAFHGFGRDAGDFKCFSSTLKAQQRLVAVNLFAHGKSRIPEGRRVTESICPSEFVSVMEAFIQQLGVDRVVLIGYSMGGRIALCWLEWMPNTVNGLLLLASDGLKVNYLANFTTGTRAGRLLHSAILNRPGLLLRPTNVVRKLRLIDKKLHRFVNVHMGNEKSRRQVYAVWHIYRHFKPNLPLIAEQLNTNKWPVLMVFGRYDSVISHRLGERFAEQLEQEHCLIVLETGHQLMADAARYLANDPRWPF